MALMTMLRNRMHVVLWSLLILFLLSMTVGGLVGGANIIDQLLGRVNPAEAIGSVNGSKITPDQFNQAVSMRLESLRSSGMEISDQQLSNIRVEVWNAFVDERLTEQAIKDLNIIITDDEVLYHLENNPPLDIQRLFFTEKNEFDEENYRRALSTPGLMNWSPIESWMRDFYLPRFKLQEYINQSVLISENDVKEEFIKNNTEYTISALHITNSTIKDSTNEFTKEELKKSYNNRIEEFQRTERRHLSFVQWPKRATLQDSQRVKEEALEIIMSYSGGDSFENLANIHSQDPSNQVTPDSGRGGDLGWFGRGQMVKAFDDAVFKANPGSVVGPVLTNFGYHIIKVDSIKNKNKKNTQVKAKHILLKIDLGQKTRTNLRRKATLFSYDAQDYNFEAALDSHKVKKESANYLNKTDFFISGLGPSRSAIRWGFNSKINEISEPIETDDYYAVFKLDSITEAGTIPFEDVQNQISSYLDEEYKNKIMSSLAKKLKNNVLNGKTFQNLKDDNNSLEFIPSDKKKLTESFISIGKSEELIGSLIYAKKNQLVGPVKTFRGYSLIMINEISEFDSTAWKSQKDIIRLNLKRLKENQTYRNWLSELKENAEIIDNREYYF